MKKKILMFLGTAFLAVAIAGCASKTPESKTEKDTDAQTTNTEDASASSISTEAEPGEKLKVALVTDPVGNQPFLKEMVRAINEGAEVYKYEPVIVECIDSAAYEDNMRALQLEGVDLLIGGGWKAGEALGKLADESPDAAAYCLLDSTVDSEHVKCISFREQEGGYLLGQMMGLASGDDETIFGQIGAFQGPGGWRWTWGYRQGLESVKPDTKLTYLVNFTESYEDPVKAKEFALQQYAQGAHYIMGLSAGGNYGIFEAAQEKGFYTSSTDTDATTPDNPYIMSTIIKDTYATTTYVLERYFAGEPWTSENEALGVKEGAMGLVHVTHPGKGPLHPNLAEADLDIIRKSVEDISDGTCPIDFSSVPPENWFPAK